ncbi:cell adhesion molecule 2-like [Carassius auratus]|uniref:Cell adhesion molecule 2-like n=1 Tax=Carassius auratus TaxID=7957 RepID=A0A6P6LK18_CARAU|nr:cell adhesion molecule 2-like [Carassius auratus]
MLQIILLLLPGVLSQWRVSYVSLSPVCAARGSNVSINCRYEYPDDQRVQQVIWCSMRKRCNCAVKPYVYDSKSNNNKKNFQYIGDKTSNCSLLISNIDQTHSGEYKFRFITSEKKYTCAPRVTILVDDLKVSMNRSRENGSTIVGDSLNLTCTLSCSGNLADVQWFKNRDLIRHSEPVLTFSRVTAEDSGSYSCSLRNFKTTLSEEITIHIEDVTWFPTVLIIVVFLVSLVFITAAVILMRRKAKTQVKPKKKREEAKRSLYCTLQKNDDAVYSTITNPQETQDVLQEV